jgi:GT2 family glycosyltransferase
VLRFLRRDPGWLAPLAGAHWDGQVLALRFAPPAPATVALDLDGIFFSETAPDAAGIARFAFAFAPGGHPAFDLLPRRARGGAPLARRALRVTWGRRGLAAAAAPPARPPRALASPAAAALVPFGVDVGARPVTVVVPVHDAPALVARCLDAVLAHTHGRARLVVIDDASPDPAIAPLLARYAPLAHVRVLRNAFNRGFTASANRGIAEAGDDDVVLLNADAEVGPGWLAALARAAHAAPDIASATAVSDNAGAFSVPELERANPLPPAWTFEQAARALLQQAGLAYPELPTGNGFCLYLRRDALAATGVLDEAAFPQGYGEENDWCQRAAAGGWRHVVAGNVLVRHARSASFGDERRAALGRAGMAVLRERWPGYEAAVGAALHSFARRVLDWRVRVAFARAGLAAPKPRLLWVGAGAPAWPDAEVWVLRAVGDRNELVHAGEVVASDRWNPRDPETSYRALWDWLQRFAFERLLVAEEKESAAEILCRLLAVPVARVAVPFAPDARTALAAAESALHSFPERPA